MAKPRTVATQALRDEMGDLLERVAQRGERFVIMSYRRPVAALVSLHDLERLTTTQKPRSAGRARKRP